MLLKGTILQNEFLYVENESKNCYSANKSSLSLSLLTGLVSVLGPMLVNETSRNQLCN